MSLSQGIDLCAIPAGGPRNGILSFKNLPTLEPIYISVTAVLIALSVPIVLGGLYIDRNKLSLADWCVVVALFFNATFTGVVLTFVGLPVCWFNAWYFKTLFVQATFFAPVFSTFKAAIFLLYRQLFDVKENMRNAINLGLIFAGVLYLPNIPLAAVVEALAVGRSWKPMLTEATSHKMVYWGLVQCSLRRVQIFSVFTTALIGIVASVLSLVYYVQLLDTPDAT